MVRGMKRKRIYAGRTKQVVKRMKMYKLAIPRQLTVLPPRMKVALTYCQDISDSSVTSVSYQVFRGNSIFDPDLTGVGHQPMGHDEWGALYKRYRVTSSMIDVQFVALNSQYHNFLIYYTNDQTTPTNFTDGAEQANAKTKYVNGITEGTVRLKCFASTVMVKGDRDLARDKDLEAQFGANPTTQWFWIIGANTPGTAGMNYRAFVTITYYCELYDRQELSQS